MTTSSVLRGYPFDVVLAMARRRSQGPQAPYYGLYQVGDAFEARPQNHDGLAELGLVAAGTWYPSAAQPRYRRNPPKQRSA